MAKIVKIHNADEFEVGSGFPCFIEDIFTEGEEGVLVSLSREDVRDAEHDLGGDMTDQERNYFAALKKMFGYQGDELLTLFISKRK